MAKMKWKVSAAYAAALLPKGYVGVRGFGPQEQYYAAIEEFGENGDTAAALLQACAVANISDKNRRGGVADVVRDMKRQMEYITGENISGAKQDALGVVSMDMTPKPVEAEGSRPAVNVIE